ncbi:hypothetical protein BVX98_03910 [bacterium F11]|nr:hypothetical protein BVX98_03910 [bacterium F11]
MKTPYLFSGLSSPTSTSSRRRPGSRSLGWGESLFENHVFHQPRDLDPGLRRGDEPEKQLNPINRYKTPWVLILFFSCFLLLRFHAFAENKMEQDATKMVSLQDVLKIAQKQNPAIKAAQKRWEAEMESISPSRSFPDPVLTFVTYKEELQTRAGPLEKKYGISQKFPFPGKRKIKGKVAKEKARMAEEAYKSKSLKVFSQVTNAYYELFYIDQSIRVNQQLADQIRHFARVAERKYATGSQTQSSVFRAQVELAKILNDLITLKQKRISALARLNSFLNRPTREPLAPEKPTHLTFDDKAEDLIKVAKKYRPEILAANALLGKSEAATSLAVRQYFPDLTVGYEISKIGSGNTNTTFDGKDAEAFRFQVNVPIWFNQMNSQYREAKAMRASSEALLMDWTNRTMFEVEDLTVKMETATRLIKLFKDTVLPQAEQALKSSQSGYEADRVRFLDLLDSIRTLLQFELEYYRYEANFGQAKAELERVMGIPLSEAKKLN